MPVRVLALYVPAVLGLAVAMALITVAAPHDAALLGLAILSSGVIGYALARVSPAPRVPDQRPHGQNVRD
jgi:hypothetical protein